MLYRLKPGAGLVALANRIIRPGDAVTLTQADLDRYGHKFELVSRETLPNNEPIAAALGQMPAEPVHTAAATRSPRRKKKK